VRLGGGEAVPAADDKFLAQCAFGLQPVGTGARPVSSAGPLRQDALIELNPAADDVLGEADRAARSEPAHQLLEPRLVLDQRQAREVAAVLMHEVEYEIDHPLGPVLRQCLLQGAEIRGAALVDHRNLAVNTGCPGP